MRKNKTTFCTIGKSRKELRKEKRLLKKLKRNRNYSNINDEKFSEDTNSTAKKPSKNSKIILQDDQLQNQKNEDLKFKKLMKEMKRQRIKQLKEDNNKEDRIIKNLEKKLKFNKKNNKVLPKSFINEGLDYILEVCNSIESHADFDYENQNDFADDLAFVTKSNSLQIKNTSSTNIENDQDDHCNDFSDSEIDSDAASSIASNLSFKNNNRKKTNSKKVRFDICNDNKEKKKKMVKFNII